MIAICTPTRESVLAGFTYDLVNLIKVAPDAIFTTAIGTYLPNLRTTLVRTALQNNCSHILFIDSDMRFPPDTLIRLLRHDKDIIGANCAQRTQKQTTARFHGKFVTSKGKTGIEEVDSIGMGVTLIKATVFQHLQEPWFAMPWVVDEKKHVGEDVYFCKMAIESGHNIWIDHDLSQEIKHVGLYEFSIE